MPQQEYRYQYINGRCALNQCYLHMHIVIRSTSWCGGCLVLIWHWRSSSRSSGPLQGSVMLVITACSLTDNFVHSPTVYPCKFIAFPLNEGHILSLVGLCKIGIANHALLSARIASERHCPGFPCSAQYTTCLKMVHLLTVLFPVSPGAIQLLVTF